MNRLQLWPPSEDAAKGSAYRIEEARLSASYDGGTCHVTFLPLHYEQNYAYPLLIWLHGPGDDETQLNRIMPLVSMRNYVAAGPRGSRQRKAAAGVPATYVWRQTDEDIQRAQASVFECIASVTQRLNVAIPRVFLAGYDCGGTMALRVAMSHPDRFAGVASLGGAFPTGQTPLRCLNLARRLPVLISFGREGRKYSMGQVCDDLRLLHAAGMKVTVRQYPCDDEITTQMLLDLDRWLMELVTGVESTPVAQFFDEPGDLN